MAFSLTAALGFNSVAYDRGLKDAQQKAAAAGASISGIFNRAGQFATPGGAMGGLMGALGMGGLFASLQKARDDVVEEARAALAGSEQTGLSVETYSSLKKLSDRLGLSGETVGGFLQKLMLARSELEAGGASAVKVGRAFSDIGLSLREVRESDGERLFQLLKRRVEELGSSGARTAQVLLALRDIGGESAGRMMPILLNKLPTENVMDEGTARGVLASESVMRERSSWLKLWWRRIGEGVQETQARASVVGGAGLSWRDLRPSIFKTLQNVWQKTGVKLDEEIDQRVNATLGAPSINPRKLAKEIEDRRLQESWADFERGVEEDEAREAAKKTKSKVPAKIAHGQAFNELAKIGGWGPALPNDDGTSRQMLDALRNIERRVMQWTAL